jgi:hypothetical protein
MGELLSMIFIIVSLTGDEGHGDAEMGRCGDAEMRRCGDAETQRPGSYFTAESAELAEQKWRVETSLRPEWSVLCGMKDLYPCHGDSGGREITYFMPQRREERLTLRSPKRLDEFS